MKKLTRTEIVEWCCLAFAAWFAAVFAVVALLTLNYPFNMEWMEGQMIDVVQRVVSGEPLYTAPSIEYVPFIYTPFYFYVTGFIAQFTGVDFLAGRLVSLLSALGAGAILYAWVKRETQNTQYGAIAAGLFFATYKITGRWFDLSRVDSLALLLMLAGFYVFFYGTHWKKAIGPAALFALAFLTKQSTLMMVLPVIAVGFVRAPKYALATLVSLAVLLTLAVCGLNSVSNGWFNFYVFEVPYGHALSTKFAVRFWAKEIALDAGPLCIMTGVLFWALWKTDRKKLLSYATLLIGVLGGTYMMRLHSFSYLNVLIPAYALLALLAGLAWPHFTRRRYIAGGLVLLQFAMLVYNPIPMVPTQKSVRQGEEFLKHISKVEGNIFMPELQFVQTRVGKKSYDFGMPAFDVMRSNMPGRNTLKANLRKKMATMVKDKQFAGVMPGRIFRLPDLTDLYVFDAELPYPQEYVTGAAKVPTRLYLRDGKIKKK